MKNIYVIQIIYYQFLKLKNSTMTMSKKLITTKYLQKSMISVLIAQNFITVSYKIQEFLLSNVDVEHALKYSVISSIFNKTNSIILLY